MDDTAARVEMVCPLNGKMCVGGRREDFPKDSVGQVRTCRWWVHLYGKDPQTEKILDQHDCSMAWLPVTTIEGSQMTRQLTATLDAHRAEMNNNLGQVAKVVSEGLRAVAQRPVMLMPSNQPPAEIENGGPHS